MSDAIRACLGQPLFENRLILALNLDKPDAHPFVEQVMGHVTYSGEVRFDVLDAVCELPRAAEAVKIALWAAYLKGAGPDPRATSPQKAA
jgi:hypothetical protein